MFTRTVQKIFIVLLMLLRKWIIFWYVEKVEYNTALNKLQLTHKNYINFRKIVKIQVIVDYIV